MVLCNFKFVTRSPISAKSLKDFSHYIFDISNKLFRRNYQIVKAIYSYLEEVPVKSPAGVQIVEGGVKSESEG